jgi:uncharacterized membrane protein YczE
MMRQLLRSRAFWWDMARLQIGFFLFGLAISLMLEAHIGLDPWSAFHDVLSRRSGLSFGRISQGVGLLLIVCSGLALAVRPGIATILNMALIGPWVDVIRPFVEFSPGPVLAVVQFVGGVGILGVASAVYIGAGLGTGPRDGLVLGLSRRIRRSLRASRIGVEVVILIVAWGLGGSIGLGTVIFALLMGPTMQASLRIFAVSHDPSPRYRLKGGTLAVLDPEPASPPQPEADTP